MMKKSLPIALLALLMAACGKSDVEKANALLQSQYPEIAQLGTITQLDSLFDVEESLVLRAQAAQISRESDSIVKAKLPLLKFLKEAGESQKCADMAKEITDMVVEMQTKVLELRQEANGKSFNAKLEFQGSHPTVKTLPFAGYVATIKNDSLEFNIYFNTKVNNILYIDGSWSYVFDKRLNN